MKNPELLTKVQLKDELIAHGVELPSKGALKAVYIDLYNAHVKSKTVPKKKLSNVAKPRKIQNNEKYRSQLENTKVKAIFTSADSERSEKSKKKIVFSASDTIKSLQKEQSNESIKTSKEQNLDDEQQFLNDLTNSEIRARLKSLGQSVGPITASTRKVYLKKLGDLLERGDVLINGKEDEVESNLPPVEVNHRSDQLSTNMEPVVLLDKTAISKYRASKLKVSHKKEERNGGGNFSKIEENYEEEEEIVVDDVDDMPEANEEEVDEVNNQQTSPAPETPSADTQPRQYERSWNPIWKQVVFTISIVLFAYLVFFFMEEKPKPLQLKGPK